MIKLKKLIKEAYAWERKFGEKLPTLASVQKKKLKEEINKLTEKLSKSDIKKMRDKFNKTGKLPPHLKKLADLMDKHKEVEDIVVPGLEWMADIKEGKLTETNKTLPPFAIAKKMMHSKYWQKVGKRMDKQVIKKFRGRGVSQKALDKWLPDYIDGGEIAALFEGKLTEANKEPLWTKETAKDAIKQIKKDLKNAVPYLDGIGTGFGGESIIGKISLDDKKTWSHNIIENSRWCLIHFFPDGTLDTIRMNGYKDYKTRKAVPILRKSKNKSIKQATDRMGKYFTVVRLKHPDTK